MLEFKSEGAFTIKNRGTMYMVPSHVTKKEAELIKEMVGSEVIIDGERHKVTGMESWLVPGYTVKEGELIGLLVA